MQNQSIFYYDEINFALKIIYMVINSLNRFICYMPSINHPEKRGWYTSDFFRRSIANRGIQIV